jgi:hypothetical protein
MQLNGMMIVIKNKKFYNRFYKKFIVYNINVNLLLTVKKNDF